ncbi:MAG TPA: PRC-barrel domain-containing protein [Bradyrhizobium sp.]|uniref:PRC-barrel domain-containing protein n=1 Tax=Bradyrhizobium sp. TaxID=376 RepID=UPI002D7E7538|nr:PRC-barrel domain-containing protein [Bradyrhizobium sp.]HET7885266.1 PRC-barrel domain-containing protein [Bradyrhizobium sp.]
MRTFLLTGAALMVLSQATMAQNPNSAQPNQPQSNVTQSDNPNASASQQHLRANLKNVLEKAGYKDIRVAPTSFMVHARDSDGNPVVMAISPDSFSEIADIYTDSTGAKSGGNANGRNANATTGTASDNAPAGSGTFVSIPQSDELSSKLVGLDIYNNDNKDIGQIKDIALNQNGRSQAYIVSVGGFLGIGEHYVAVSPQAVKITYNDQDKKWHASMNATADQLKAAPEFKYSGRWQSNKT